MATLAEIILSDLIANQPSAGIAGRLFYATDESKIYRDNGSTWDELVVGGSSSGNVLAPDIPPASPHASDDEFDDSSLDVAWTQYDGPSSSATVSWTERADGNLWGSVVNEPSWYLHSLEKAVPVGDFTFAIGVSHMSHGPNGFYKCVGIIVGEGTTAQAASMLIMQPNDRYVRHYGTTNYDGGGLAQNTSIEVGELPTNFALRFRKDTGTWYWEYSPDGGYTWWSIYSLAEPFTAAHCGIVLGPQSGTQGATAVIKWARFDWTSS